ncbi:hypothetical protein D9M68_785860 [compost metagenome]
MRNSDDRVSTDGFVKQVHRLPVSVHGNDQGGLPWANKLRDRGGPRGEVVEGDGLTLGELL